jgi:hypothetical protein
MELLSGRLSLQSRIGSCASAKYVAIQLAVFGKSSFLDSVGVSQNHTSAPQTSQLYIIIEWSHNPPAGHKTISATL